MTAEERTSVLIRAINTPGSPESRDHWQAVRDTIVAAEKETAALLLAACAQDNDTGVTPLEWLSALLTEIEASGWASQQEDGEAALTALEESSRLLKRLRAAVAKAG